MLMRKLFDRYGISPYLLGKSVGDGSDGECFEIIDQPNKIAKLGITFCNGPSKLSKSHGAFTNAIEAVIEKQPHAFVRVYEYRYLGGYMRKMPDWEDGQQRFVLYAYLMDKLFPVDGADKPLLYGVLDWLENESGKPFDCKKISSAIDGEKSVAIMTDESIARVNRFANGISSAPIIHQDLHIRNIMKDNLGEFNLIDLDRMVLR